jgi:hypothetical protein
MEIVSCIAFNYTQHREQTSEPIDIPAKNSLADQKEECTKEFFPLIFGCSFIIIDERQVCFE